MAHACEEVGDHVERDEEIATIETDKVRFITARGFLLRRLIEVIRLTSLSMPLKLVNSQSFWPTRKILLP